MREYKREYPLYIVKDNKAVKPREIIEAVHEMCGVGSLFACIAKSGNMYEITVKDKTVKTFLLDGLSCGGKYSIVPPS